MELFFSHLNFFHNIQHFSRLPEDFQPNTYNFNILDKMRSIPKSDIITEQPSKLIFFFSGQLAIKSLHLVAKGFF